MFKSQKFFPYAGAYSGDTEELLSFDNALINAGVDCYNLVKVSSILPPHFQQSKDIDVPPGEVLFTAYTALSEKGMGIISAAIGIGIPEYESSIGVIMEYSCHDSKLVAATKVKEMTLAAMKARDISIKEVLVASAEVELSQDNYSTVIAGVGLW